METELGFTTRRAGGGRAFRGRRLESRYLDSYKIGNAGGVSPPVPTRGETPRELTGEDACGT